MFYLPWPLKTGELTTCMHGLWISMCCFSCHRFEMDRKNLVINLVNQTQMAYFSFYIWEAYHIIWYASQSCRSIDILIFMW